MVFVSSGYLADTKHPSESQTSCCYLLLFNPRLLSSSRCGSSSGGRRAPRGLSFGEERHDVRAIELGSTTERGGILCRVYSLLGCDWSWGRLERCFEAGSKRKRVLFKSLARDHLVLCPAEKRATRSSSLQHIILTFRHPLHITLLFPQTLSHSTNEYTMIHVPHVAVGSVCMHLAQVASLQKNPPSSSSI